jgi:hypothetical protein
MMSEEYEKAVEIGKKIAVLQRQLDELKAQLPQPEPFKPKAPMRRHDPTEGFRMPANAIKAMCDVVPDRMMADIVREQKAGLSAPSGFGAPGPKGEKPVERGSGWAEPPKAKDRSDEYRIFDAMVAHMVGGPNEPVK